MTTNLPPQAKKKWAEVTEARDPKDKIRLMQEFLALVPRHKGTEKLQSQVRRRISQLKEEIEKAESRRKGTKRASLMEKAGAAQVIILGPTKVGKSMLLNTVTNAKPPIGEAPFMTRKPIPGMLRYEDIQMQVVETPAVQPGLSEGKAEGTKTLNLVRNSDGIILMVDLSQDTVNQYQLLATELEKAQILTARPEGEVEITKRYTGSNIQFVWEGELQDCNMTEVSQVLREYKITSALLRIRGKVTLDMIENSIFGNPTYKPTLLLANKTDLPNAYQNLETLRENVPDLEILPISCLKPKGLQDLLGKKLFQLLGIVRIYTKETGSEPTSAPFITKQGATIQSVAKMIHSDFIKNFKYARIWGPSAKFPGERVGLSHHLQDRDIVKIHA